MAQCPTPAPLPRFDVRSVRSCAGKLRMVLDAYEAAISGGTRIQVRFQERWTEYQKSDAMELRNYYMTLWAQCPDAARYGLPDLTSSVRRGPPARGVTYFGRF